MALKGNRVETISEISFFMNEVAERGGIVCMSTAGSGAALDQSAALVTYAAAPTSGSPKAMGMLMNDMVNIDQTRQHINWHKDEVQKGGKVRILREGWAVTDMIYPGVTPTAGQIAYVAHSGYISNASIIPNGKLEVGFFDSVKDEDGYARVYVKLPNINAHV